jgi:hypothetical protein
VEALNLIALDYVVLTISSVHLRGSHGKSNDGDMLVRVVGFKNRRKYQLYPRPWELLLGQSNLPSNVSTSFSISPIDDE